MTTASAPGKIILFGEHAVVYGRPALAVPIHAVQATATVTERADARILIEARELARRYALADARANDPLALIIRTTLARLNRGERVGLTIAVGSTIPIAGGLGSGAAISVAVARALANHFNATLSDAEISELAYGVEKIHHDTPSGIDNMVIAHDCAIVFRKGVGWDALKIAKPFWLAIADTGVASPTKITVGEVRRAWKQERALYEKYFDAMANVVERAREAMERGEPERLGALMDENQKLLEALGVSAESNERLIEAARRAGAWGAKLSGGGRGGNIIALVKDSTREEIARALDSAGAKRVILVEVKSEK